MEGQDRTHVDPFVTLSMLAGRTERLTLGTASLIPYRHPINTALALSSLERVAGPGRVIAGFGIGTFDHEFEAVGLGGIKRADLLREQVEIMRKLWTGETVSHQGAHYTFADVDIHPTPSERGIPIWYCGNSPLSVRKAVEYCDGWMPGRITIKTFRKRMERLRQLSDEARRDMPTAASIPIISPGRSREEALAFVNWREMMGQAINSKWETPDSGEWSAPEDLEGALIVGTADDIIEGVTGYQEAGLRHLVFDLRFRFADWEECLIFLGEEVLPRLPGHTGANTPARAMPDPART
jgi:alkanesulfonate monooxygenase SsuD/methylene tetrahydromethanopterin reductase-like flavin-dependent oxidoreductase (luciferase family)